MAEPRFLQIHTLSAYAAALLNRDDSGLAKRLPYGEALRTRVLRSASNGIGESPRPPIPWMRSMARRQPTARGNW